MTAGDMLRKWPSACNYDGMFPVFLIQIVIVLIVIGLAMWILGQIPMDATIARIIRVIIIVFVCLWLLSLLMGYAGAGGPHLFIR